MGYSLDHSFVCDGNWPGAVMGNKYNLVWMDLEMDGLDPRVNTILEIATIVTDLNLEVLETGPVVAIHHDKKRLDQMDAWNKQHHGDSGLVDRVLASKYTMEEAEKETMDFIKKYCGHRESPLCGNSVGQDRRFLDRYMLELNEYLHYRIIDVSTIKELSYRWFPTLPAFEKENKHTALDDIVESIEEMKYYREKLFLKKERK